MTQEDKAKAYDEALEKAKQIIVEYDYDEHNNVFMEIFPELKESEDERIRKELLSFCQNRADNYPNDPKYANIGKWIAWLEKQGEQKPANKTEPFDKYEGLTDFERTLADICIGWIGEELGWKQYIKDNADVLLKIAIEKFNSVQDASFEQKPAWSEEDEAKLKSILFHIEDVENNDVIDWLKSLKDRVQPQPKVEWSKEDETKMRSALAFIKSEFPKKGNEEIMKDTIAWLKSLKERYAWKPSEKQMNAFEQVYDWYNNNFAPSETLTSLYNDLKKLREE